MRRTPLLPLLLGVLVLGVVGWRPEEDSLVLTIETTSIREVEENWQAAEFVLTVNGELKVMTLRRRDMKKDLLRGKVVTYDEAGVEVEQDFPEVFRFSGVDSDGKPAELQVVNNDFKNPVLRGSLYAGGIRHDIQPSFHSPIHPEGMKQNVALLERELMKRQGYTFEKAEDHQRRQTVGPKPSTTLADFPSLTGPDIPADCPTSSVELVIDTATDYLVYDNIAGANLPGVSTNQDIINFITNEVVDLLSYLSDLYGTTTNVYLVVGVIRVETASNNLGAGWTSGARGWNAAGMCNVPDRSTFFGDSLNAFGFWVNSESSFDGSALAQLLTGCLPGGGGFSQSGLAWTGGSTPGVVCRTSGSGGSWGFSHKTSISTYGFGTHTTTSHEIAHNWGCDHTDPSVDSLMNSGSDATTFTRVTQSTMCTYYNDNAGLCAVPYTGSCDCPSIWECGSRCNIACQQQCGGSDVCMQDTKTCCTPLCGERQCGSDGCGGTCGDCAGDDICTSDFQCTARTGDAQDWVNDINRERALIGVSELISYDFTIETCMETFVVPGSCTTPWPSCTGIRTSGAGTFGGSNPISRHDAISSYINRVLEEATRYDCETDSFATGSSYWQGQYRNYVANSNVGLRFACSFQPECTSYGAYGYKVVCSLTSPLAAFDTNNCPSADSPCTPLLCGAASCDLDQTDDGCGGLRDCPCPSSQDCYQSSCCSPKTCIGEGFECGSIPVADKCGGVAELCGNFNGGCDTGFACSNNNVCECISPSLDEACAGVQCGNVIDRCGNTRNCGGCSGQNECISNVCVCQELSATDACAGAACGIADTGCQSSVSCGTCGGSDNNQCQAGSCVCVPDSQEVACAAAGATCGSVSDGCGGTRICSSCTGQDQCRDGVCECVPLDITACGTRKCGTVPDGCGGDVECGVCTGNQQDCASATQTCECVPLDIAACGTRNCGTVPDGCGGDVECGVCTGNQDQCLSGSCTCIGLDSSIACPGDCGIANDGCSGVINCGTCTGNQDQCLSGSCTCVPLLACPGNLECGSISDGCGGTVTCGSCGASETCTADLLCESSCVNPTCAGKECDSVVLCNSSSLDCGTCSGGELCVEHQCVCTSLTQAQACAGKTCGTADDGCGNTLICGTCASPNVCSIAGACQCQPKTKAEACGSQQCGTADDGCGGTYNCGDFDGTCNPNSQDACDSNFQCTCQPLTREQVTCTTECGDVADGCGGSVPCGNCAAIYNSLYTCETDTCVCNPIEQTLACGSRTCGTVSDRCTGTYECGTGCTGQGQCVGGACVCQPLSSSAACNVNDQCGERRDGCGDNVSCGTCAGGDVCVDYACCTPLTCPSGFCGQMSDGCGTTLDCGGCGANEACIMNSCTCNDPCWADQCGSESTSCGSFTCGDCDSGNVCNFDQSVGYARCEFDQTVSCPAGTEYVDATNGCVPVTSGPDCSNTDFSQIRAHWSLSSNPVLTPVTIPGTGCPLDGDPLPGPCTSFIESNQALNWPCANLWVYNDRLSGDLGDGTMADFRVNNPADGSFGVFMWGNNLVDSDSSVSYRYTYAMYKEQSLVLGIHQYSADGGTQNIGYGNTQVSLPFTVTANTWYRIKIERPSHPYEAYGYCRVEGTLYQLNDAFVPVLQATGGLWYRCGDIASYGTSGQFGLLHNGDGDYDNVLILSRAGAQFQLFIPFCPSEENLKFHFAALLGISPDDISNIVCGNQQRRQAVAGGAIPIAFDITSTTTPAVQLVAQLQALLQSGAAGVPFNAAAGFSTVPGGLGVPQSPVAPPASVLATPPATAASSGGSGGGGLSGGEIAGITIGATAAALLLVGGAILIATKGSDDDDSSSSSKGQAEVAEEPEADLQKNKGVPVMNPESHQRRVNENEMTSVTQRTGVQK